MDLYSRKIVGWSIRDDLRGPSGVDAISMAVACRKPKPGLFHHSDRGSQYTSIAMGRTLRDSKTMASSWAARATPGTTPAQRAASRRSEQARKAAHFATRDQARIALFRYIEAVYNPLWRHSSLGMLSPDDYEHRYWADNAAAAAA